MPMAQYRNLHFMIMILLSLIFVCHMLFPRLTILAITADVAFHFFIGSNNQDFEMNVGLKCLLLASYNTTIHNLLLRVIFQLLMKMCDSMGSRFGSIFSHSVYLMGILNINNNVILSGC